MNILKNKVQLIGNLGNNPVVRMLDGGKKFAKFSLATNESYKRSDGKRARETKWFNLIAWNKTAVIVEKYLKKGSEVAIEGWLVNSVYVDKQGIARKVTEVQVSEVLLLGSNN